MNLRDYSNSIVQSTPDDWTIIGCWGFGSGPSYLERTSVWSSGRDEFSGMDVESHGMVASLKSDLSISMAWGLQSNPNFIEDWANRFCDPHASSGFIDFFYNGVLVFRDIYVSVDGARCRLPLPKIERDESGNRTRLIVSRERYNFFKMHDGFEQISEFDEYFDRAGFEIVESPWME